MQLKIFIDRLKQGKEVIIEETLKGACLVDDPELTFPPNVEVSGRAYLANAYLVVRLELQATAILPCKICNANVPVAISIKNFHHIKPIAKIPSSVYDCLEEVRQAILLETPNFAECRQGNCLERKALGRYFAKDMSKSQKVHHPFAQMDDADKK